jgi:hypothetical protein
LIKAASTVALVVAEVVVVVVAVIVKGQLRQRSLGAATGPHPVLAQELWDGGQGEARDGGEGEARDVEGEEDDEDDEAGKVRAGGDVDADKRDVVGDAEERGHRIGLPQTHTHTHTLSLLRREGGRWPGGLRIKGRKRIQGKEE